MSRNPVLMTRFPVVVGLLATLVLSQHPPQPTGGGTASQDPVASKRVAINLSDNEIPLALTSVKNLDGDNWIEEMEFEVENRSNRPIYHVLIIVSFPDAPKITGRDGKPSGFGTIAEYGRKDFGVHQEELAREDDIPIRPGERGVLRLESQYREGVKHYLFDHNFPESAIRQVRVRVDQISFGDGSGFVAGSIPFPWRGSPQ